MTLRSARALDFPARPIKLVLSFPPGGVFDIVGRPWAARVKGTLGTVIVENLAGVAGSTAAAAVAHAHSDGSTILLGASSIHLTEMILRDHRSDEGLGYHFHAGDKQNRNNVNRRIYRSVVYGLNGPSRWMGGQVSE